MKALLKSLANGVAAVLVLPSYLAFRAAGLLLDTSKVFPGWSQAFSLIPGLTGAYCRRAFYRYVAQQCAPDVCLSFGTVFSHQDICLGRRVYIGVFCCLGEVTLEDDVLIGSHVSIVNGGAQHGIDRLDVPIREQPGTFPRITIGCDSWIGERSVIQANVGRHCVIGAGSVVTKPIPDYAVAVGVPARVTRFRNQADPSRPVRPAMLEAGAS
jgi:acetyltransferase-like isoleucine patch superfamily enzyme